MLRVAGRPDVVSLRTNWANRLVVAHPAIGCPRERLWMIAAVFALRELAHDAARRPASSHDLPLRPPGGARPADPAPAAGPLRQDADSQLFARRRAGDAFHQ